MKHKVIIIGLVIYLIFYSIFSIGLIVKLSDEIVYLTDSNKEKLEILIKKNEEIDILKDQLNTIPK